MIRDRKRAWGFSMVVLYVLVAWMALDGVRGGRVDAAGRKRGFSVDEV